MEKQLPEVPDMFAENLKKMRVIVYYYDGILQNEIAKKLDIGKGTISKWISKFKESGNVLEFKRKPGRPSKFDDDIAEFVVKKLKKNPDITQRELSDFIKIEKSKEVSQTTISKHLVNFGSYKIPQTVPLLSVKNREKRLDYAKFHKNDMFSNVVFSDESKFQVFSNTRKVFVFKDHVQQKASINPNYSVMVWGAISKKGKIAFTFIDGTMTKEKYIQTLKENLLPSCAIVFQNTRWRFQQDNAPVIKCML